MAFLLAFLGQQSRHCDSRNPRIQQFASSKANTLCVTLQHNSNMHTTLINSIDILCSQHFIIVNSLWAIFCKINNVDFESIFFVILYLRVLWKELFKLLEEQFSILFDILLFSFFYLDTLQIEGAAWLNSECYKKHLVDPLVFPGLQGFVRVLHS